MAQTLNDLQNAMADAQNRSRAIQARMHYHATCHDLSTNLINLDAFYEAQSLFLKAREEETKAICAYHEARAKGVA